MFAMNNKSSLSILSIVRLKVDLKRYIGKKICRLILLAFQYVSSPLPRFRIDWGEIIFWEIWEAFKQTRPVAGLPTSVAEIQISENIINLYAMNPYCVFSHVQADFRCWEMEIHGRSLWKTLFFNIMKRFSISRLIRGFSKLQFRVYQHLQTCYLRNCFFVFLVWVTSENNKMNYH